MTIPANVRVNFGSPFPATVKGLPQGLVAIDKQNGIWTVTLNYAAVGQSPVINDPLNTFVLAWNAVTGLYTLIPVSAIGGTQAPTNVNFAMSPYVPTVADSILYVDTSGGAVVINLLPAASRLGRPLAIKDVTGNAAANNVTINRNGAETIEGLLSIQIAANYGGYSLYPATGKYVIAP